MPGGSQVGRLPAPGLPDVVSPEYDVPWLPAGTDTRIRSTVYRSRPPATSAEAPSRQARGPPWNTAAHHWPSSATGPLCRQTDWSAMRLPSAGPELALDLPAGQAGGVQLAARRPRRPAGRPGRAQLSTGLRSRPWRRGCSENLQPRARVPSAVDRRCVVWPPVRGGGRTSSGSWTRHHDRDDVRPVRRQRPRRRARAERRRWWVMASAVNITSATQTSMKPTQRPAGMSSWK